MPRPAEPAIPDDPGLLLIIDGLTDPAVTAGLVPRASHTTILITATCPHVDDGFRHVPVGGLSPVDAGTYLRRVLPAAAEDDLSVLIEAFDGNPLGLAQGANYCLTTGLTPGPYIDRLRRDPARVLDLGHAADHPQTIAAAIRAGVTEASRDPAARALASALAWLAPDQVPEWIFAGPPVLVQRGGEDDLDQDHPAQEAAQDITALADPLVLDAAVATLARHGLVRRGPGGLRMHSLVQDITRALGDRPTQHAQHEATVGLLLMAMTPEEASTSADILTPHVAAAAEASGEVGADPLITSYLMTWLGNQHYDYGDLPAARSYLDQAVALARSGWRCCGPSCCRHGTMDRSAAARPTCSMTTRTADMAFSLNLPGHPGLDGPRGRCNSYGRQASTSSVTGCPVAAPSGRGHGYQRSTRQCHGHHVRGD